MSRDKVIVQLLDALQAIAPCGYSVGLHIRYATPLVYRSTYPDAWIQEYNDNAYYLRDPVVFWGVGVAGTCRWSQIRFPDPFGVMKKAARHGLTFGAVGSVGPITSRSIVGIARADREFDAGELALLGDLVERLHGAATPPANLTRAQKEALRAIANGDRHAAAAARLRISESALKARLHSARVRLEARTTAEAVRKARESRQI